MGVLNEALSPIDGFLIKIERDTKNGWYFFEVGFPENWFYKENEHVTAEILKTIEGKGKIIKIAPKNDDVDSDYIIEYIRKVVEVNKSVSEREKMFKDEMEEFKTSFQGKIADFETQMESFKDKAFNFGETPVPVEDEDNETSSTPLTPPKKRGRPKKTE